MPPRILGKYNDIASDAQIGDGTTIWSWIYIGKGTVIGRNCKICNWVQVDRYCKIGDDCSLQPGVILNEGMQVGDRVWFSGGVVFSDERFPSVGNQVRKPTIVEDDVIFGIGSLIVGGVKIGRRSVIGMGSVVLKDVSPETVVVGNPAKVLYSRREYDSRKSGWETRVLGSQALRID